MPAHAVAKCISDSEVLAKAVLQAGLAFGVVDKLI